jgi:hypothetical protein
MSSDTSSSIKFRIKNAEYEITQRDVQDALANVVPNPISVHGVFVNGTWFPVVQAFRIVTGSNPADIRSSRARSKFKALGFPMRGERSTKAELPTTPSGRATHSRVVSGRTKRTASLKQTARDADYVLDLCDELLRSHGSREHTFPWLVGDLSSKNGRRKKLPVDSFWEDLGLVVEVMESQHYASTPHFDKPDVLTVSGVHRGAQRRIYDARKAEVIPSRGLRLVHIRSTDFEFRGKRIVRQPELDRATLRRLLGLSQNGEFTDDPLGTNGQR